jgi:hypothetical protein
MSRCAHRAPESRLRRMLRRIDWSTVLGILLIVACAYIVTAQYRAGEESQRRGECQTHVNEELVASLQVRDANNQRIRDAQQDVVRLRVDQDATDAAILEADLRYLDALVAADRGRDSYPIPEVIRC